METRANYVIVGLFTLVVLAAGFAFVYWVARIGERVNLVELNLRVFGAAAGLGQGSDVLFNGVKVGKVTGVAIDAGDPRLVHVFTQVDANTPLRKDTAASLGSQGLAGIAYVSLRGGTPDGEPLLGDDRPAPTLDVSGAAVGDLMETARDLAARVSTAVDSMQQLIRENRESLSATIRNAEIFTEALAENADGVDKFLAGVSKAAESIDGLSERLDGSIASLEKILAAVDPEKVRSTIDSVNEFTASLNGSGDDIRGLIDTAKGAMGDLQRFSEGINTSLGNVDRIIAGVDAEKVTAMVDNVSSAAQSARAVADSAREVADTLSNRKDEIRTIVDNLTQFSERINVASARADGIMDKLDGFLGTGDAAPVMAELRETLEQYKQLGQTLNGRVEEIASGLSRFSNRGLDDMRQLVQEARRSVARIDRTVSELEANPQRFLFGGDEVREYSGRPRR